MKKERNGLCTCGSGKKYKKCCMHLEAKTPSIPYVHSDMFEVCDKVLAKMEAGDILGAESEAEHLYQLHPNDHMVNYLKGVCLLERQRIEDAAYFFEKAVEINPNFCEAYYNLGMLHRKQIHMPQSIDCFRRIIEINGAQGAMGKLAKKELDWFENMLQTTSGQTTDEYLKANKLFDEAHACLATTQYQRAISLFKQVLTINPDHAPSFSNMALAHSAIGEQKLALQCLDQALIIDPTYEPAKQNRIAINQLKEGEKNPFKMKDVFYSKEKAEAELINTNV